MELGGGAGCWLRQAEAGEPPCGGALAGEAEEAGRLSAWLAARVCVCWPLPVWLRLLRFLRFNDIVSSKDPRVVDETNTPRIFAVCLRVDTAKFRFDQGWRNSGTVQRNRSVQARGPDACTARATSSFPDPASP